MNRRAFKPLLVLALVLNATLALAFTVSGLTTRATALSATYTDLATRIEACPGGTCADRDAIISDFAAAQAARAQLHTDRDTLNPCSNCQTLDSKIGNVDALAALGPSTEPDWWDGLS